MGQWTSVLLAVVVDEAVERFDLRRSLAENASAEILWDYSDDYWGCPITNASASAGTITAGSTGATAAGAAVAEAPAAGAAAEGVAAAGEAEPASPVSIPPSPPGSEPFSPGTSPPTIIESFLGIDTHGSMFQTDRCEQGYGDTETDLVDEADLADLEELLAVADRRRQANGDVLLHEDEEYIELDQLQDDTGGALEQDDAGRWHVPRDDVAPNAVRADAIRRVAAARSWPSRPLAPSAPTSLPPVLKRRAESPPQDCAPTSKRRVSLLSSSSSEEVRFTL